MKELSIEEKAKRYDEAIKRIEDIETGKCKKTFVFTEGLFEHIFPELKESEDERIRKELIFSASRATGTFGGIPWDRVVAWLEKQGEHADFINKIHIGDKVTRNEAGILVNMSQLNRVAKKQDKQDSLVFPKYKTGDILTDGKSKYNVLSWDYTEKGTPAYYMEGNGCKFSWGCKDADEKLTKVDEQKPAWSEEDETVLNNLIYALANDRIGNDRDEYISYLKSLKDRYTWKPSDEQMKVLNEVLNFAANHESSHWNDYIFGTLNNLIRQFKKLREE